MASWKVIPTDNYVISLALITDDPSEIAIATNLLDYALSRNPKGFNHLPGSADIYVAKTKFILNAGDIIPALRLWVQVIDATHEVLKQWIEICPPHDM
jgi:hypothetical protein